jgi:hypothetical protein
MLSISKALSSGQAQTYHKLEFTSDTQSYYKQDGAVSHPPAGATTLIVSLGIIALPKDLLVIEAAVILLTLQAFVLNRLAGMPYPLWHQHSASVDVP